MTHNDYIIKEGSLNGRFYIYAWNAGNDDWSSIVESARGYPTEKAAFDAAKKHAARKGVQAAIVARHQKGEGTPPLILGHVGTAHKTKAVRKRAERAFDQHAATELQLYIENDSGLYRQKQSIEKNLEKKILKGKFDLKLSEKLWMYWVDEGAKKYAKEFGDAREWHKMFDVPTRQHVAAQVAKDFVTEWNANNRK